MRRIFLPLITVCLFHSELQSQELKNAGTATWTVARAGWNTPFGSGTDRMTRDNIIYVSETEAVMPFNEAEKADRTGLSTKYDMHGVAKVNNKGQVKWKTQLHHGKMLGIAQFDKNILVFTVPEWTSSKTAWTILSKIQATLLDGTNGKKILEKDIPIKATSFTQIEVHKNEVGEFQQLSVRHTKWDGTKGMNENKYEKQCSQTSLIELFTINKELVAEQKASFRVANDDLQFIESVMDKSGRLDVMWATSSSLILEQYAAGTPQPVAKIMTDFEWNDKWKQQSVLLANGNNPNQVAFTIRYKKGGGNSPYFMKTVQFNLSTKKAIAFDEPLNNDYRKDLEPKTEAPEGYKKDLAKMPFYNMEISDLLFYGNNLILIKEARGSSPGATNGVFHYYTGDVVITVFDQNGTPLKHFLLNKYVERFIGAALSFGSSISGDKLQFVTMEDGKKLSYSYLYGSINLKEMKWEKVDFIKEGGSAVREKIPVDPDCTLWFPKSNSAVLFLLEQNAWSSVNFISQLRVLTQ